MYLNLSRPNRIQGALTVVGEHDIMVRATMDAECNLNVDFHTPLGLPGLTGKVTLQQGKSEVLQGTALYSGEQAFVSYICCCALSYPVPSPLWLRWAIGYRGLTILRKPMHARSRSYGYQRLANCDYVSPSPRRGWLFWHGTSRETGVYGARGGVLMWCIQ